MTPYRRRVQYYETDMMGVTHHANYIHFMEEARIDFMDQLGYPYAEMEKNGVVSPVTSVSCEYKKPSTFGDELTVAVSVQAFNGVVLTIGYEISNSAGELVARARSEHVFLTRSGAFVRVKRELPGFYEALIKSAAR